MIKSLYPPFQKWAEKGTIWVYADTHFGEQRRADYGDGNIIERISDKEHLNKINNKIGKYDTFILLGDVGDIEVAKQIRGYKVLLTGNHDVGHTKYEKIFDEVYDGPLFIMPKLVLSHEEILGLPYVFNIHGHNHTSKDCGNYHLNVCSNIIDYEPLNLNKFIKEGGLSKVVGIHVYYKPAVSDKSQSIG